MARLSQSIRQLFARQGVFIILVSAILLEVIGMVQFFFAKKGLREEADRRAQSELALTRLEVEKITESVETAARNLVWVLEDRLDRPDSLFVPLRQLLEVNPSIMDAAVGFVSGYYPEKGHWYEPLIARRADGSLEEMVLGSPEHDYFVYPWYQVPAETGESGWSEPYYDESGGRTMVVTYSVPVHGPDGKQVGILGVDISLEWLAELVDRIRLYPHSYSTIRSREGQLLAAPAETLQVVHALRHEMSLGETGWKMSIVIPVDDIYRDVRKVNTLILLLQLLTLALLALIVARTARGYRKLEEAEIGKQRMENELEIARGIQMSMIPKVFPPFPDRHDLDIYASIVPAREVSGDLYDFYIRADKLFFCIGDVSGKGVPASLVMAVTRGLFRTVSGHLESPAQIVESMNQSMSDMNESCMFVTFFCGVLDLKTGLLRYCNAGHNAPVVLNGNKELLPVEPNIPLGIESAMHFREQEITLVYDDALFLYTDGLTEAENRQHALFGEERMKAALSGRKSSLAHMHVVQQAVADFVGDAPQSDDLTMLFIHYLPAPAETRDVPAPAESRELPEIRELVLDNEIGQISRIFPFVESMARERGWDDARTSQLNLALEEAVTNVIMYAYPAGTPGQVYIRSSYQDGSLCFVIRDRGVPFNPTAHATVDISLGLGDRPVGGLGIHLVREIMDDVQYERKGDYNILTLKKNL